MGFWTDRNKKAASKPASKAEPKALTVFDMLDLEECSYLHGSDALDGKTRVFLLFKHKTSNSPQSGSEMMKDYPERESHREGQEYTMVLTGDSAERFYKDYNEHMAQKKAEKSGPSRP